MDNFKNEDIDILFNIISKLKTKEECLDFFTDLCTIKEIQDMAKRFKAAKMLSIGKSYKDIIEKIEISTATLSRVNKCLNYGTGGYKKAISKIN